MSSGGQSEVVVGVDGSVAANRAVLWAAAEAQRRGLPLRLLAVLDPADATADEDDTQRAAIAEAVLHQARSSVAQAVPELTVELEIARDKPLDALRRASRSAALVCTGVRGRRHFADGHTGSTAASLARTAHCPVAVIDDHDHAAPGQDGCVVAEVNDSVDGDTVVQLAVTEALQRHSALRVLSTRGAAPQLERRIDRWRRKHPDLEIVTDVVTVPFSDYLNQHTGEIQLAIAAQPDLGGSASAVLIANPHRM